MKRDVIMEDAVTSFELKHGPIDGVMDSYYTWSEDCNWNKIVAMKKLMKGAINITKSLTGECVLKTNRIEKARMRDRMQRLRREKAGADAVVNHSKIVFKAKYSKWMNNMRTMPKSVRVLKDKYKRIRSELRSRKASTIARSNTGFSSVFKTAVSSRKLSSWDGKKPAFIETVKDAAVLNEDNLGPNLKATNYLVSPLLDKNGKRRKTKQIQKSKSDACDDKSDEVTNVNSAATERRVLSGGRQIVSRDMVRRRQVALWREKTFNMDSIRSMLVDQDLRQQAMYCKLGINNYKKEKQRMESTLTDKYKLTTALAIERQRSASTVSELPPSRPETVDSRRGFSSSNFGGFLPPIQAKQTTTPRKVHKGEMGEVVQSFEKLKLKRKQVSFYN